MRILSIALCCFSIGVSLFAQTDSLPRTFFPCQVGDLWNYQFAPGLTGQTKLVRDSIAGDERFLFFDTAHVPLYKIDTALNVTFNPLRGSNAWLVYKLTANTNDVWTVNGDTAGRIAGRVDSVFWAVILGKITQVKAIGYYRQGSDTTYFFGWLYEDYLAAGFGLVLEITDASQTPAEELVGCIIDGTTYGSVVAVNDERRKTISSDYKLFPPYPNPFNPMTTIDYSLAHRGEVKISIFNLLGVSVATLINRSQEDGTHSIRFQPVDLPSGVYFIRMVTKEISLTSKIIYSK